MTLYLKVTIPFFLIACLATQYTNSRSKDSTANNKRWLKLGVYFLNVHTILSVLIFVETLFIPLMLSISIMGALEIWQKGTIMAQLTKSEINMTVLAYCVICFAFLKFSTLPYPYIARVYIIIIFFDGFSQIAGQIIGKRQLAKLISPSKTIEGTMGGFTFALIALYLLDNNRRIPGEIAFCAFICLAALTGDLLASAYKRKLAIKDFCNLIPGHGGVLDRFDSFIMAGAFACFPYHQLNLL